jgi:hypothetical protein
MDRKEREGKEKGRGGRRERRGAGRELAPKRKKPNSAHGFNRHK